MRNYEATKPSYFATPSPQLIRALHTSLTQVLSVPLSDRFAAHHQASLRIKQAVTDLGLEQLAEDPKNQANGMTAFYLPDSVVATELLPNLLEKRVILAGGLHKDIKGKYVRMGHMGISVVSEALSMLDLETCYSSRRSAARELDGQLTLSSDGSEER